MKNKTITLNPVEIQAHIHALELARGIIGDREKEIAELKGDNKELDEYNTRAVLKIGELLAHIEEFRLEILAADCKEYPELYALVDSIPSQSLAKHDAGIIQKIIDGAYKKYSHLVDIALHLSELQKIADDMKGKES